MTRFLWPLALFLLLVGFLAVGLGLNPREVPSPLIDKPAPAFALPNLHAPETKITRDDLKGKVWLLNVWASWCVSCRQEHPLLVQLAKSGIVPIYGLNYKDERDAGLKWLSEQGDPYTASIMDSDGRIGIEYGVYGVPETFVIDKQGIIRHKHIGPITPQALEEKLLPMVRELNAS